YTVKWHASSDAPFDPVSHPDHADHVRQLCDDVCERLVYSMLEHTKKRPFVDFKLAQVLYEQVEHREFVRRELVGYVERPELEEVVEGVARGSVGDPRGFFLVSGNDYPVTVLRDKHFMLIKHTTSIPRSLVVHRFIGTTPRSTNLTLLLLSLTYQIYTFYTLLGYNHIHDEQMKQWLENWLVMQPWEVGGVGTVAGYQLEGVRNAFWRCLAGATKEHPLVLVLDGVGGLEGDGDDFE
ncbi:hypothetical protein HK104_007821, partial [Borealophlyctis nickersoniae]